MPRGRPKRQAPIERFALNLADAELLSGVFKRVDRHRGVAGGTTEHELNEITARRNRIAHAADRVGSRRATLSFTNAQSAVAAVRGIGHAIAEVAQSVRSP